MIRISGLCLLTLLIASHALADISPIADVKQIDSSGRPLLYGKTVTVTGVVTVGTGTYNTKDLDIYIQDKTGGINVTVANAATYVVEPGDSLTVTGTVYQGGATPTRGNTMLTVLSVGNIQIVGKGTIPDPIAITSSQLNGAAQPPVELYEGQLVSLQGVTFNPADWPGAGADKIFTASDPAGSFSVRIDKDTGIGGTVAPGQPLIVIGVVVQNATYPYLSGYTVWPRTRYGDFLKMGSGSGFAEVSPDQVDNDVEAFDLAVRISGNSVDVIEAFTVDLPLADGWGWAGGSENVEVSGPGVEGAGYEVTATGVSVTGSAIAGRDAFGRVTFKNVSPPPIRIASEVTVRTSADGVVFGPVEPQPVLEAVYPVPPIVVSEVYPNDGTTSQSDAFIELHNQGDLTAYLEGCALCDQPSGEFCAPKVRYVFGPADSVPAQGYIVIAESAGGFQARFGKQADVAAPISPLGRVSGDGGTCGEGATYEAISVWRDSDLSELISYLEYKDAIACATDMCEDFGTEDDAFPYIPPKKYSLLGGIAYATEPWRALTAAPTPGEPNVKAYISPVVTSVTSHSRSVVEVLFSEPVTQATLGNTANFGVNGRQPLKIYPSLSLEKVLIHVEAFEAGQSVALSVKGIESLPGKTLRDTVVDFRISVAACVGMCDVQAYDDKGYSPLDGQAVCVVGFITVPQGVFQPDYQSIYVQGLDGCGVNVFAYDKKRPAPVAGDLVLVNGQVEEYVSSSGAGSTTELFMSSPQNLTVLSRGYPEPAPLVLATGRIGREENEGKFVMTEGAVVRAADISFYLDDGTGAIQIYQNYTLIDFTRFEVGMYVKIKGVILQYDYTAPFTEGYELVPRYESDIEIIEDAFPPRALLDVEPRVFCPSCGDDGFPIRFGGPATSNVVLRLFDTSGRLVTTLYDGVSVGENTIAWDGRNSDGKLVPPGLYVCFMEVVESQTGKTSTESVPIVVGIALE